MVLTDNELLFIKGGAVSSTFLNAISRLITTVLDLGRTIGSTIYRYKTGNYCR